MPNEAINTPPCQAFPECSCAFERRHLLGQEGEQTLGDAIRWHVRSMVALLAKFPHPDPECLHCSLYIHLHRAEIYLDLPRSGDAHKTEFKSLSWK